MMPENYFNVMLSSMYVKSVMYVDYSFLFNQKLFNCKKTPISKNYNQLFSTALMDN